jgi:hypothetical protein
VKQVTFGERVCANSFLKNFGGRKSGARTLFSSEIYRERQFAAELTRRRQRWGAEHRVTPLDLAARHNAYRFAVALMRRGLETEKMEG